MPEDEQNIKIAGQLSEEEKERLAEILAKKLREEILNERDRCGYSS